MLVMPYMTATVFDMGCMHILLPPLISGTAESRHIPEGLRSTVSASPVDAEETWRSADSAEEWIKCSVHVLHAGPSPQILGYDKSAAEGHFSLRIQLGEKRR